MRNLKELDMYRDTDAELNRYGVTGKRHFGVFRLDNWNEPELRIIADTGQGWDHVSVSTVSRTPTWEEMDRVKRLFFKDKETAMQLHVPTKDHVNTHPFCLHLWRPTRQHIPRPDGLRV